MKLVAGTDTAPDGVEKPSKGRNRKSAFMKSISGTDRPDRKEPPLSLEQIKAIELSTIVETPQPPEWMVEENALEEWYRLCPILIARGTLKQGQLGALSHLCSLHGTAVRTWKAGGVPQSSLLVQLRAYSNDFGLTPNSAGKMKSSEIKPKTNAFSSNGKRQA